MNVCKHSKKWFNNLVCFGFNLNLLTSLDVYNEFYRIKDLLYREYIDNKLSISEIKEKYNYKGSIERLVKIFNNIGIPLRKYTEAINNAILKGRCKLPEGLNKYQCGWYTTWEGKKFFLRSSYEFDYAKLLDKQKIKYDVENFRIKYWDDKEKRYRIAIPDFYLIDTNTIVEIKSNYTLDIENMKYKFNEYKKLGFNTKLILEHQEINID